MLIRIEGYGVPTTPGAPTRAVRVGVQRLREVEQLKPLGADDLSWELTGAVHPLAAGRVDLRGPYVHGRRGDRFLYLAWCSLDESSGAITMFRRAKLMLDVVDPATLTRAGDGDLTLVGRLSLVGRDGTAVCAAVRPPAIAWAVT